MLTDLERFVSTVQRRQLTTPLFLMAAGHRPLTFLTGQLLYLLAPLCLLLGWHEVSDWATLFSSPDAAQRLSALSMAAPATAAPSNAVLDD